MSLGMRLQGYYIVGVPITRTKQLYSFSPTTPPLLSFLLPLSFALIESSMVVVTGCLFSLICYSKLYQLLFSSGGKLVEVVL